MDGLHRPFFMSRELLERNSLGRALGSAGAALQALIGVDLVVDLSHVDGFSRALSCASAAGQAIIADNVRHIVTPYVFFRPFGPHFFCIVTQLRKKSMPIFTSLYYLFRKMEILFSARAVSSAFRGRAAYDKEQKPWDFPRGGKRFEEQRKVFTAGRNCH